MGFLSSLLGIVGFGIGIPLGLLIGFFLFIYSKPKTVKEPITRPLYELDNKALLDLLPDIPLWVKCPDYERVDWLNKFVTDMWPYLDKAVCARIRSMTEPLFAKYIGKFQIEAIEFDNLSLGALPPEIHGLKVCETNEKELVLEPAVRWAGNPNIVLVLKLLSFRITVQLVDLQIFMAPRITLKPLVPTLPCFATVIVSLLEKPDVDFGLSVLGGDIMAIPGLYQFVQKTIKQQVASLYLWPQTLEIPILDAATVAVKKPVGILHVKVVRAQKLLKKDILGTSDPYVKLNLSGERLPAKKTTIKKRNLNPEWNEKFKLIVKDPESQVLQLQVFDWDKVGNHDHLGMQFVPLKNLTPYEMKEFKLDLLKHTYTDDHQDKKQRGKIVVELTYAPFRPESQDSFKLDGPRDRYERKESGFYRQSDSEVFGGAGLLSVMVRGAEDVEGERHNNPYAVVLFRGETKKTKMIKKTRDPLWNDEFHFMLEEPPLNEKIHIDVMSKRTGISFRSKEHLGYVDINLTDVVRNGRINQKYHLIDSKGRHVFLSKQYIFTCFLLERCMEDSTPLLSHYDQPVEPKRPRSLDETIEWCIGDFGWSQFLQAILVSFAWVFDAQQTFISVFTDAEPSWHCTQVEKESVCDSFSNICQLPKNSWSWDWPAHTSIISEWGLECSTSFITGLPASSFFMGCLAGGLALATLADSTLGRRNMLFFSCLMMSLSSIFTVFSSNIWIYSALRFINGFGRATIGTCALVLSTELVGKRWRGQVGVIGFFCFTLGFLSLPLIAYINRGSSWRNLYLWTSVPTILYCILVRFLVHESPRWLFVRGRKEEAVSTLKSMANQSALTMSFSNVLIEQESWNVDLFSSIKILLNKRWAARRLAAVMVAGVGIGMVYYGMPLSLGNLSFNLYLSVTFNAIAELPSSLITFFVIGKFNRKDSLLGFTILSGFCSVLCVVMGKVSPVLQIGMELISFFSACTAFSISLIYTIELFPTCVRNSALSMVRQALVFGGVVSPLLVAAGRKNDFPSFVVFGIVIAIGGLPVLGLPETRGGTICDTMDEEEHKENEKAAAIATLA